jgi:hypothetical protein
MSAAVAAKGLRQRIPAPEEIMAAKSAAGHGRRGRPPKKVKSCPPMDTGKLHSQTNQAQVLKPLLLKIDTGINYAKKWSPQNENVNNDLPSFCLSCSL